ncbi:MAG: exodeoxyribonuclease III [Anaerolineales bacterium]|nr:exodeoxyribonuclease III [Anaerolineales bacterium]
MEWKLISWNVNGIRAVEKKGFLDWLLASDADLVAVQETKAHPGQLSPALLNPPGYQAAWSSAEKKGYSGTGTYSRSAPLRVVEGLGDSRFDTEGRTLIHEFEPFVFFNIYFPNGGRGPEWVAHKLAFYRRFLDVARGYMQAGRPVVVTGDFNTAYAEIDLARPKENVGHSGFMPEERAGLGEFFEIGLIDTFRHLHPDTVKYSWWNMVTRARERNVGWRLDYFMVSPDLKEKIVAADIHDDVYGSDHCPVSLGLSL